MRLAEDRQAAALELAEELTTRRVRLSDKETIEDLILEEQESQERSEAAAAKTTHAPYRKSMKSAAANSAAIIRLLEQALDFASKKDTGAVIEQLRSAAEYRATLKESRKSTAGSISKLYEQYLQTTDSQFHAWLKENDQEWALAQLGVARPKKQRRSAHDGRSNRPEDY